MGHPVNIQSAGSYNRDLSQPSPATGFVLVTPSDSYEFDPPLRGFTIGGGGNIKMDTLQNTGEILPSAALIVGYQYALVIKKIYATGTSATTIIGWR